MSLTLTDALSQYRSVSEATHRFWGYFQAVAAGTAAFAWSREPPADTQVFIFLALAFAVFAALNWRLVVNSQSEAEVVARCIRAYVSSPSAATPSELLPIIQRIRPDSARLVGFWHAGLSLATLFAVWWRYNSLTH